MRLRLENLGMACGRVEIIIVLRVDFSSSLNLPKSSESESRHADIEHAGSAGYDVDVVVVFLLAHLESGGIANSVTADLSTPPSLRSGSGRDDKL